MRIVLRNKQTGHYFKKPGEWTRQESEAYDFPTGAGALLFSKETGLPDLEMILIYRNGQRIRLDITKEPLPETTDQEENLKRKLWRSEE